jgi:hypothetical protein
MQEVDKDKLDKIMKEKGLEKPDNVVPIEQGWRGKLKHHVLNFNKEHAMVMVNGNARVMRKTTAKTSIYGREGYEFIKPWELDFLYQKQLIKVGEKKNGDDIMANIFEAWRKHPDSDVYIKGVIFQPNGEVPDGYLNLWHGFSVAPADLADYPLIKWHIDNIICGGTTELIDYFYKWMAYTFQHPEKQAEVALVLRGEKGSGKGSIGHFLMKIWGQHAFHITNAGQVTGRFNGHLSDVCFLFADEAFFSGDVKNESVLKGLVTEPFITSEKKGMDAVQVKNYLKIFMTTNKDHAVPASKGERRWAVYDVTDEKCGDVAYFKALKKEMKDPWVRSTFLYDMMAMDLKGWTPRNPPESNGLKDQRMESLDSAGKWLVDYLMTAEDLEFGMPEKPKFNELYVSYMTYCSSHKISEWNIYSAKKLGSYLTKVFGLPRRERDVNYNSQTLYRFYNFGTIDQAKEIVENYEKILI